MGEISSTFEFHVKSPDHSASASSPERLHDTPDYIRRNVQRNRLAPVELFTDAGLECFDSDSGLEANAPERVSKDSPLGESEALEASIELGEIPEVQNILININVGGEDECVACGSINYQKDSFYSGGDIVRTDVQVGCSIGQALYQTARLGNFSYNFQQIEAGNYLVELHFAEIVFTGGPPGMRIFDVFVQEKKVVSSLDVYARVGANKPLVISDLGASVLGTEGLSIRLEGLVGRPILSAISVRWDSSAGKNFHSQVPGDASPVIGKEKEKCSDCRKLMRDNQLLLKEQTECKRALENLKRENELKSRECHKAWKSLQQLQMELMQKSMHVGSLAFAVEGQVKEKSRWFQSLAGLSEKFHMLKLEHTKLSREALQLRTYLADITQMTTAIQSTMDHHKNLEKVYDDLKLRFAEEAKEHKDLYNKIIELKGNIRVFCRCRPLNMEEQAGGATMVVDFESAKDGELIVKGHVSSKRVFKFDSVFSPEEDQEAVFEKTAPFATSVLDGYNVCIFAYGQTGTGKTFTMEGTEEARGVNYRTLDELFRVIREREGLFQYEVTVSVLEVYNEQLHDLLLPGLQPGVAAKRLEVRQVAEGVHHVPGLVEARVSNTSDAWEVLKTGNKARAVGSTNANEHSSRSHCIHCVMVRGENLVNGECTRSKLWLIDLAGSERLTKTDAQGERLKEAQNINKSLSALGDVISALANKSAHIPFRNSKLTHLLQDSLGGDSKTLMFVQISPNEDDVGETLCSLNFASRVRGVELGPAKRQVDVSEVVRYKHMVGKAKEDSKHKDSQMKKMEETIHSLEVKNKAKDLVNKNLQDKVKELESQLLIERKLARQHVDTRIAEYQLHHHQQQQWLQQKQKEQDILTVKPLATSPMSEKNHSHVTEYVTPFKELVNLTQPLPDINSHRLMVLTQNENNSSKHFPWTKDKENKPDFCEDTFPRKASRISLCPTSRQLPVVTAQRRNSLIPLPVTKAAAAILPMPTNIMDNISPPAQVIPDNTGSGNPEKRSQARSSKKINSILRRSLQKKVIVRPQLPPTIRRGNTLAGIDKLRVSIGSSGRKARRVVVSNATNFDRGMLQRQQRKEKERGWNHGTTARNIF